MAKQIYRPYLTPSPLSVLANKVSQVCKHPHSLLCLWLLPQYNGGAEKLTETKLAAKLKIFIIWSIAEKKFYIKAFSLVCGLAASVLSFLRGFHLNHHLQREFSLITQSNMASCHKPYHLYYCPLFINLFTIHLPCLEYVFHGKITF
jgi:hypothetical protein